MKYYEQGEIKVPSNVYEELVALEREIHFTLDTQDTVRRAEDRGYMAAANWIRQNENAYKVGFSWGFEPEAEEPHSTIRDVPERSEPVQKRTVAHPPTLQASRLSPSPAGPPETIHIRVRQRERHYCRYKKLDQQILLIAVLF